MVSSLQTGASFQRTSSCLQQGPFIYSSNLNASNFAACRFGDPRDVMRPILGDAVTNRVPQIWGLNGEEELSGVWREIGTEGLWYMLGAYLCSLYVP